MSNDLSLPTEAELAVLNWDDDYSPELFKVIRRLAEHNDSHSIVNFSAKEISELIQDDVDDFFSRASDTKVYSDKDDDYDWGIILGLYKDDPFESYEIIIPNDVVALLVNEADAPLSYSSLVKNYNKFKPEILESYNKIVLDFIASEIDEMISYFEKGYSDEELCKIYLEKDTVLGEELKAQSNESVPSSSSPRPF